MAGYGLKVDDSRGGAGRFRDLYIGTGVAHLTLALACDDLRRHGVSAALAVVDNPEHPAHGQMMLEVPSFWF